MYHVKYINKNALKKISRIILLSASMTLLTTSGCSKDTEYEDIPTHITHADSIEDNIINDSILVMHFSDITDEDLASIPSDVDHLQFEDCYFLNNLDQLPKLFPNLKVLTIIHCPSVVNLDFIYDMPNLTFFCCDDCAGVNQELKDYLDEHNIDNNITERDIMVSKKIDEIYASIIKDDMTDEEKIRAITCYIVDNYDYDEEYITESNLDPLYSMVTTNKGVCAGYAYLADVLLCKAGINSHYVIDADHAWNIIEEDDKYYYLDTTNIDTNDYISSIKKLNSAPYYMSSPNNTYASSMTPYNAGEGKIIMPKSFVDDIAAGEDIKTLKEKYNGDFVLYWLKSLIPTILIIGLAGGALSVQLKSLIKQAKVKEEKEKKKRF